MVIRRTVKELTMPDNVIQHLNDKDKMEGYRRGSDDPGLTLDQLDAIDDDDYDELPSSSLLPPESSLSVAGVGLLLANRDAQPQPTTFQADIWGAPHTHQIWV